MKLFNKNVFKQPFFWTSVCSLLALGILIGLYSYAWVAPIANPNNSAGAAISFSGGNVGIGTASPASILNINLNNTDYTNTGGAGSHIVMTNPNASGQNVISSIINGVMMAKWRTDYVGNISWVAGTTGAHDFYTGGDYPTGTSKLHISNNGNVGIGMTTPSEKLEVAGNIKMTGTGNGIKFPDGTSQTTAATAGGNMSWPTSVKETTATHNGLFATSPANGYAALETWIQSNGCSTYHVCMPWELTYAFGHLGGANLCGDGTCTGRYNSGLYAETSSSSYNSTDCVGWTSNDSNGWLRSQYWTNKAPATLKLCSELVGFLCCK